MVWIFDVELENHQNKPYYLSNKVNPVQKRNLISLLKNQNNINKALKKVIRTEIWVAYHWLLS
ncbi:MAG: hypothetical protein EA361_00300 [Bacteroidetes bacterium]|nr:MAG: hypothetical protein EA361_00300 [Bacteroidota bacterium]